MAGSTPSPARNALTTSQTLRPQSPAGRRRLNGNGHRRWGVDAAEAPLRRGPSREAEKPRSLTPFVIWGAVILALTWCAV
jgi:hypothetical protein